MLTYGNIEMIEDMLKTLREFGIEYGALIRIIQRKMVNPRITRKKTRFDDKEELNLCKKDVVRTSEDEELGIPDTTDGGSANLKKYLRALKTLQGMGLESVWNRRMRDRGGFV